MRLGLLADIHEAVEPLQEAIERFRELQVDEILHVGDICRMHRRLKETCKILKEANVAGVWGNHDLGLCREVEEKFHESFGEEVLSYMAGLSPQLVREDCLLSHVEPWLDANDVSQLWYFDGLPDSVEKLAKSFTAVTQRILFSGHVHRWFVGVPQGPCAWDGEGSLRLAPPQRYLVILHAVVEGHCAVYDTTTFEFTPVRLRRTA